jgi:hypothetical protein
MQRFILSDFFQQPVIVKSVVFKPNQSARQAAATRWSAPSIEGCTSPELAMRCLSIDDDDTTSTT